ncbi:hypothetical protein C2E23DRAFT_858614 [Lenzites betulinus]|nr:hypothetical protein C2E23DRAFT_858614 [Lenzites betulinus]
MLLSQRAVWAVPTAEPGPVPFNLAGTYDDRLGRYVNFSPSGRERDRERERMTASAAAPRRALLQLFSIGTSWVASAARELLPELHGRRVGNVREHQSAQRFVATEHGRVAVQKTGASEPNRNPFVHPDSAQLQAVEDSRSSSAYDCSTPFVNSPDATQSFAALSGR